MNIIMYTLTYDFVIYKISNCINKHARVSLATAEREVKKKNSLPRSFTLTSSIYFLFFEYIIFQFIFTYICFLLSSPSARFTCALYTRFGWLTSRALYIQIRMRFLIFTYNKYYNISYRYAFLFPVFCRIFFYLTYVFTTARDIKNHIYIIYMYL